MIRVISGSCETAAEEGDACDHDPDLGAGDAALEVLGEASVASEPGEGALDDPAFRFRLESAELLGMPDDFDCPAAELGDRIGELTTAIDAISKDVRQRGEAAPQRTKQRHLAVNILDVGRLNQKRQRQALRVGDNVPFAAFDALKHVKAARAATFRRL